MTVHLDVETLSTYLDQELSQVEHSRVEDHLDRCDECQERLLSLRRIVGDLQSLERLAPPADLGAHLHRLASLHASPPSLIQRLEAKVSRFTYPSNILPLFAVVMALIVIIYMLSLGLHRQATGRIPVHLEPQGLELEEMERVELREIDGRLFRRQGDVWVEQGLESAAVEEEVQPSDPRIAEWFAGNRQLEEIAGLGSRVRLQTPAGVVEILFAAP